MVSVNPLTDTVYVNDVSCSPCSESVIAINGTTGRQAGAVDLGGVFANGIAVDPDTDTVYAISADSGMLYAIDGASNSLVDKLALPGPAFGVAVDPNTDIVYVVACTSPLVSVVCETNLYAINGSNLSMTDMGPVDGPEAVIMDTATNTLYETSGSTLISINGATGASTVTLLSAFPMSCYGLTVDPLYNYVYVSCYYSHQVPSLFILDGSNDQVLNSFTGAGSPSAMVFSAGTDSAYIIYQNGYVLNLVSTYIPLP